MINRNRQKELLLEMISDKDFIQQDIFLPDAFTEDKKFLINFDPKFVLQDRFCVKMETDEFVVRPERIKGFKIETIENKKIIKIKTYLQIHEWINDFQSVHIIKVYFFDGNGNILKNCIDYDVNFMNFLLECDYKFRDYLVPIFSYEILGF